MRILFVNRIAWPDQGATALYLTDVAEACAAAGHEVHVVCGVAQYRKLWGLRPVPPRFHSGVHYHRIPGSRGRSLAARSIAAATFLLRCALRIFRVRRPDVVVALTDPPFLDAVACAVGRLRGARTIHWIMDAFPDTAVAAGILARGSKVSRALWSTMAAALKRGNAVVVLSHRMRRTMLAKGVPRRRLHVIENWAPAEIEGATGAIPCARKPRPTTLMYSGTYGRAHDLTPLFRALERPLPGEHIRLILQVSGARVAALREQASALPIEVVWRDPVPLGELTASLREADIHVASVAPGFERLLVPSKIYAPLALGLPVLALGMAGCWAESRRVARATVASAPGLTERMISWISGIGPLVVKDARWPRARADGIRRWAQLIGTTAGPRQGYGRAVPRASVSAGATCPDMICSEQDPLQARGDFPFGIDPNRGGARVVTR